MTLAYIDSFSGLVPCKIIGREQGLNAPMGFPKDLTLIARVTAARPGYERNEIVRLSTRRAVPRSAVYVKRGTNGQYRIRPYDWHNIP